MSNLFNNLPVKEKGHPILSIINTKNDITKNEQENTIVIDKITEYQPPKNSEEVILKTDELSQTERKILIGMHTYGHHNLSAVAAFVGLPLSIVQSLLFQEADPKLQKGTRDQIELSKGKWYTKTTLYKHYENGEIPCYTRAELVSRLCVIADQAKQEKDRIMAIDKLMQFRGIIAPEGGSRSFERTLMKFQKGA